MHLSYIAHSRKDYKESLALCESAKEIYESLGPETDNAVLAHVYSGMSYSLSELQRNEEAAIAGKHAIDLLEQINSPDVLKAYRDEGRLTFYAKRYQESISWYQRAIEYVSPDDSVQNKGWDHFCVARAQTKLGKYEEALSNLIISRDLFKQEKALVYMAYCDEELAQVYGNLGQLNFARTHAELALDFAKTSEDEIRTYWSHVRYAQVCFKEGNFQEAHDFFKAAKSWEVSKEEYTFWPHVFYLELQMANCVEKLGNFDDAEETRRRVNNLVESTGLIPETL